MSVEGEQARVCYAWTLLPSFFGAQARLWKDATKDWYGLITMTFDILNNYSKNKPVAEQPQTLQNTDQGQSPVQNGLFSVQSRSWIEQSSTSTAPPQVTNQETSTVGDGCKICIHSYSNKLNEKAYKWEVTFPSESKALGFKKAIDEFCSQMMEKITEYEKSRKGSKMFEAAKKTKTGHVEVDWLSVIRKIAMDYLLLKKENQKSGKSLFNQYSKVTSEGIRKLFNGDIANSILSEHEFFPSKERDGSKTLPTVITDFMYDEMLNRPFPHIKLEEIFIVNRLREVEWSDPHQVVPLDSLLKTKDLSYVPETPYTFCIDVNNCDWFFYIKGFEASNANRLANEFEKTETTTDYDSYCKKMDKRREYGTNLLNILFNPYASTELLKKYQKPVVALLKHLKNNRNIATENKITLFGFPVKKNDNTTFEYSTFDNYSIGNELVYFIEFVYYGCIRFLGCTQGDASTLLSILFGSYGQFDSRGLKKVNFFNDGPPGCGKSHGHNLLKMMMVPGTYVDGGMDASKQAEFSTENQAGYCKFSDESNNFLDASNKTAEAESLRKAFKQLATSGVLGRQIMALVKQVNPFSGSETSERLTQNWNIYNDTIYYQNSNKTSKCMDPSVLSRFTEQHSVDIPTPQIMSLQIYSALKKIVGQEKSQRFTCMMQDLQVGAMLTHKTAFMGLEPTSYLSDLYTKIVVSTIVCELNKRGFNIPDIRKTESINVITSQINIAYSWFKTCCLSPNETEELTGINHGKPYTPKFIFDAGLAQNTLLGQIVCGTSLFFETLIDYNIELLKSFFFGTLIGLSKQIALMDVDVFDIKPDNNRKLGYSWYLLAMANKFKDRTIKGMNFMEVEGKIKQTNQDEKKKTGQEESTNPKKGVDIYFNPNYIEIDVESIHALATQITNSPASNGIHGPAAIEKMINGLQTTKIIPKTTLQYVSKTELYGLTRKLYGGAAWKKFLNKDGTLRTDMTGINQDGQQALESLKKDIDNLFKPAENGKPYHPKFKSDIFTEKAEQPILIIQPNLKDRKKILIHIEIARMDHHTEFDSVVASLSRFCANPTPVPIVTRRGLKIVTIPKHVAKNFTGSEKEKELALKGPDGWMYSDKIRVPIESPCISNSVESSKETIRKADLFFKTVWKTSNSRINTDDIEDFELTKTKKFAKAITDQKDYYELPSHHGLDDFFQSLHLELHGIK